MQGNALKEIAESIDNGTFKRQHDSIVRISKDGQIMFDKIIKDGEDVEIRNKNQIEAFKKKMEKENAMKEHIMRNEGDFVHFMFSFLQPAFVRLEERCGGNKANIHIIRFIKLTVHLNFNDNLYDNDRNRIKKGNLGKIWDTKNNRKSVYETYDILKEEGFIYETEEGYIMINTELVKKGNMDDYEKLMDKDWRKSYTRLFSENIQQMYNNTNPKNRKQLANLFKAIPYINFKYNVFCENPIETDEDKIIPLKWSDLARLCGYDEKKQLARFKKDFFNLSISGYDVIGQFTSKSGYSIVINPKVFYGGNDIEDVKALYAMFKMSMN